MRRSLMALSDGVNLSSHPKHAMTWRPGTHGFYAAKKGASKFKWTYRIPYRRDSASLLHHPEVSKITGKPIDWYHAEPSDGYEGARIYGEHTLELKGMPYGRTPEYMQERLRRFFAKFGPVKYCRALPHPLDPYQCEGTAHITFRDRTTALKALKAPLKFPASLHDKVVHMRHLDSDKENDADYREKAKFWDSELIALARQLHVQLSTDPELREKGKPLRLAGQGLMERELVNPARTAGADALAAAAAGVPGAMAPTPRGRGGVPLPKGLHGAPTRLVRAETAVRRRFGSWEAFFAEPPFDELFRMELRPAESQDTSSDGSGMSSKAQSSTVVVLPRFLTAVHRTRVLARARLALAKRLHAEFSPWWREGKVPLPEYTQRRMLWWDHKPHLPFDIQIMSRPKERYKIFDERFLFKQTLVRARNEKRRERKAEWNIEKNRLRGEKQEKLEARRHEALMAVNTSKCRALLGSPGPRAS
mmetsp:Transcript_58382/g.126285  ORF Transcript_58382/g.126285 Transcript_58382/m.126285 type:complete len:476 (-) Transcript_58382:62-1489(-)